MQHALLLSKEERIYHHLNIQLLPSSTSHSFQNLDFFQCESFNKPKYFKASNRFLKSYFRTTQSDILSLQFHLHDFPQGTQMY